ncbi:MAG: DUF3039 domain-containing protein [Corynebacterium casei]|uniref:DUF3039 domain-containing protein n=1 Tax=Corynebacterium casei TaxID=160386 RepID=UPI003F8DF194
MFIRRARPTLRLIREDLTSDWESPHFKRSLEAGRVDELSPMAELPHPIIRKAADSFGEDPERDNFVQPIASSTQVPLLEIKSAQWRGGVWRDPGTGVCWLLVAGLAKGDHQDADDFYVQIKRQDEQGKPERWLPSEADVRILKRETAAHLRTEWELGIQFEVLNGLRAIYDGGTYLFDVDHILPGKGRIASVEISIVQERPVSGNADGEHFVPTDDIVVEFMPRSQYEGSNLLWQLIQRVLTSIEPPQQVWDRFGNTFSNLGEPGVWGSRIQTLSEAVEAKQLLFSEPGKFSHYTHRKHLAGKTVEGSGVRSMCGVYFVPAQDHGALPTCSTCEEMYSLLPKE